MIGSNPCENDQNYTHSHANPNSNHCALASTLSILFLSLRRAARRAVRDRGIVLITAWWIEQLQRNIKGRNVLKVAVGIISIYFAG